MAKPDIWEESFRIHTFHTNPKGVAHLTAICNFLQEGASRHAEALGFGIDDMIRNRQTWVLSRLHVEVIRLPAWKELIKLTTWPRGNEGIFYYRDFMIIDEKGGDIAKATSSWAAINMKTRRPGIVKDHDEQFNKLKDKVALQTRLEKLPPVKHLEFMRRHTVVFTDIDILYHVNNVKYIELIINSFPLEKLMKNAIKSIEVNYLGESKYDETLVISGEKESAGTELINVTREADDKEVCRARVEWA